MADQPVPEAGGTVDERRRDKPPVPVPRGSTPPRPWRTEGVPPGDGDGGGRRWPAWARRAAVFAAIYLVVFAVLSYQDRAGAPPTVTYTEFTRQVEAGNVAEVFSRGDRIEGVLDEPAPLPDGGSDDGGDGSDAGGDGAPTYQEFVTHRPSFAQDDLLAELEDQGAVVLAEPVEDQRGTFANLLISFAPWLLIIAFYWWLFRRQRRALGGMGGFLGGRKQKPVDPEQVRVSFDDVAGIDEVEAEISEIVDYLRDPGKYRRLGARAPKGVLLSGPPGTGKTLLARATAGEADVPFFSASGSEFIEMIVGVGAQRVRELFEEARKVAPSIIFIDEIDTIGRARGGSVSVGGHDEREQTLNQILTEMDGFSGSEGVVVLAATNRPDVLDPALLRAGPFDRTVVVNPPDHAGRVAILGIHTRKVPLADDADLDTLASATPGMTGADLANLVNEAAFAAARDGLDAVPHRYFTAALEKIQLGTARDVVIPEDERRRTAYHEAGHALLGMVQPGADPVRKVSIIPRGRALGVTLATPERDRYGYDEAYLRGRIIGALGGRAAEELVYGVVTTGAENDLEVATRLARTMVGRWGMSERVGPVSVLPAEGDPRMLGVSDEALALVDQEVRRLVEACEAEALRLLGAHRDRLEAVAAALLEHETLDEADVYAVAGIAAAGRDPDAVAAPAGDP